MINLRPRTEGRASATRQIPEMEKLDIMGPFHFAKPHNQIGQVFSEGKMSKRLTGSKGVSLMKDYFMWKETLGKKQMCSFLLLSTRSNVTVSRK